jgi:hypothetical protein
MEYDNRGKVSLWKNDRGGSGPILSGKVVAHRDIKEGETIDIALWKRDAAGNQPVMTGKIQDVYNSSAAVEEDDLPF